MLILKFEFRNSKTKLKMPFLRQKFQKCLSSFTRRKPSSDCDKTDRRFPQIIKVRPDHKMKSSTLIPWCSKSGICQSHKTSLSNAIRNPKLGIRRQPRLHFVAFPRSFPGEDEKQRVSLIFFSFLQMATTFPCSLTLEQLLQYFSFWSE